MEAVFSDMVLNYALQAPLTTAQTTAQAVKTGRAPPQAHAFNRLTAAPGGRVWGQMRFQTLWEGRAIFAVVLVLGASGYALHWPWLVALAAGAAGAGPPARRSSASTSTP